MRFAVSAASALLLFLAVLLAEAASAVTVYSAQINASQEVGGGDASASGTATLTLSDAEDRLEIFIQLFGLDLDGSQTVSTSDNVTLAHIHAAPAGVNGGVVFGFIGPNNDLNGDLVVNAAAGTIFSAWDASEGNGTTLAAQLANLMSEGLYINIHTSAFPGGAIRGQIVPEPTTGLLLGSALALLAIRRRRA